MPSLHEIEMEIGNVLAVAEELPEDTAPVALEYLEELAIQEADKIDAIGYAIRKRESEISFLKDEEQRINNKRKAMESRLASFKMYLRDIMLRNGIKNVKGSKSTLYLRQSESVVIDHAAELPEKFVEMRVEYKPIKGKIRDAIKDGAKVPGAYLEQRTSACIR